MTNKLTSRQVEIIEGIFDDITLGEFVKKIDNNQLSFAEIDQVCLVMNDEFLMKGILADYEPNEYGREIEDILDIVNRPRLKPAK